ncbi:MAG: flagellar hook-basal body complex protein FliE [Thermoguttaceae bacterium]|nr:flagellar hook-basal body complex protein FliE [Thermoguttaceae bacterium]MDW8077449.1 flagellar hook-basal body complex protein FliE [Thermoguttaceae bacterium]
MEPISGAVGRHIVDPRIPAVLPGQYAAPPSLGTSPSQPSEFRDLLLRSIEQVNAMQQEANQAVEALAAGQELSPAEVLVAVQKADLAFRLMMQIRNKLVQVYQELQNIRV